MLLTLILNLDMAAGVVSPISPIPPTPPTPPTVGGGGSYTDRYESRDREVRLEEQRDKNQKILIEILKFWSKEMQ